MPWWTGWTRGSLPWRVPMLPDFIRERFPEWTTDSAGVLICPHGNRCEDDLREHGDCGCESPYVTLGLI